MTKQGLSGCRELYLPSITFKQLYFEMLLYLVNMFGNGRLCNEQLFACFGEAEPALTLPSSMDHSIQLPAGSASQSAGALFGHNPMTRKRLMRSSGISK